MNMANWYRSSRIAMEWEIKVLNDPLIKVVHRDNVGSSCLVRIGCLRTIVRYYIRKLPETGYVICYCSHQLNTPLACKTKAPGIHLRHIKTYDPAYALYKAVNYMLSEYREAIRVGHAPSEDWLVRVPPDCCEHTV
jgi:hypothetical protein